MVTKDAAEHLGTDAFGTIAPGKLADLILVDGDPTKNISALRNVLVVIKNGTILFDRI
jgi:imidazolonepropionase-like amidohydrolase